MVEVDSGADRGGAVDIGGPIGVDGLDDGRSDLISRCRPPKCLDGLLQLTKAEHRRERIMLVERMMGVGHHWLLAQ